MSKRGSGGSELSLSKKLRNSNGSSDCRVVNMEIDEDLHSRQLAVYGRESMRKMAGAAVLVLGAGGLGVEVAKNVILAGVRAVTIHDTKRVSVPDLGAQFYLSEGDVGRNRAQACYERLQELNTGVMVTASTDELTAEFLSGFNVVVDTARPLEEAIRIDDLCHGHSPPISFIRAEIAGVFGSVFCDFGPAFRVEDVNGEPELTGIVASITTGAPALVTCVDDQRLEFEDGMLVTFSEVEGMVELNGHPPIRVRNCKAHSFELELDTTAFGDYLKAGIVSQVKEGKTLGFKNLSQALKDPGEFLQSDFAKLDRPPLLHVAFQALAAFRSASGRMPAPGNVADAENLIHLGKRICAEGGGDVNLDAQILHKFASGASAELNPVAAVFGGIVGQEVVKATSGKFHPIFQFFYMDAVECLPKDPIPPEDLQPLGCRYDNQIAVFGKSLQQKLGELKVFLVGAGALGCEFLKNFSLMGLACGANGLCTVTDDDVIEKSNLSRQFLFRDWNIGNPKSTVAAAAATKINPKFRVDALQNRVSADTEELFNDKFWTGLDLVVNALDNVNARLYVDYRCVYFSKPLMESGTLGTKCNTQVVIPRLTENYGASRDPPEKGLAMCTVHSFPHSIDHCLAWAMSEFEGLLGSWAAEANTFLEDPQTYKSKRQNTTDAGVRGQLEQVVFGLTTNLCKNFQDCISSARLKFEDYFHNKIAQLVYTFPEDSVTSSNTPFWSAPKRFPRVVDFRISDPDHVSLIQAMSILIATVYGVEIPEWAKDRAHVASEVSKVQVPKFTPKDHVHIETDPEATNKPAVVNPDDECAIGELLASLDDAHRKFPAGFRLRPIKFEKDDDSNFHVDMIAGLANMRARNYSIPEVDKFKAKLTAGKIIPAIATSTALATGLIGLEIYKVIQSKPVEYYRNTFANLALPLFAMAEPVPPKIIKYKGLEWSLWDRWIMEGDVTVQEVIDWFSQKGIEAYGISVGTSMLYSNFYPRHKERVHKKLSELVTTVGKQEIPPWRNHFDVSVACDDDDGEILDVPVVSIKFR